MNDNSEMAVGGGRGRTWLVLGIMTAALVGACGASTAEDAEGGGDTDAPDAGAPFGGEPAGDAPPPPPVPRTFDVALVPEGVAGVQRVNLAVPLAPGDLTDEAAVVVRAGGVELPAARRALARHADGSLRSVQVQVDVDVDATRALTIELGAPGAVGPALVDVRSLVDGSGASTHPRVWAVLPASVLAASGLTGPAIPAADVAGTALAAWSEFCDYDRWGTAAFLVNATASRDVWLYDRVTAMYRGYAVTGEVSPLRSAYREAGLYLDGMTIASGVTTAIAVPNASTDLKYHYAQGVALHYLLTGDDRFREAAEAVSRRVAAMWDPDYDGSDEFWTERHAGFALLAHTWARRVSDDQAAVIAAREEGAVDAYLAVLATDRFGQADPSARCLAHTASAHAEPYGGAGCSPWMSAIVMDALDGYARDVGGARAAQVRGALVAMGRAFAQGGRDAEGRPLYWMGVGGSPDEVDGYDEHWGEGAYVAALAWDASGRTDAALRQVADELVAGFRSRGEIGHVRSFNWQCRSAVMTPALLK